LKRTIIAMAVLLAGMLGAQATTHSVDTYHDLRPAGQKRSDAAFNHDVEVCKRLTHDSHYQHDSPAMRQCMRSRDWLWQSSRWVADPPEQPGRVLDHPYECPGRDC
jgi:hypothetical protein